MFDYSLYRSQNDEILGTKKAKDEIVTASVKYLLKKFWRQFVVFHLVALLW
jgi:uncharacterized membrane protein